MILFNLAPSALLLSIYFLWSTRPAQGIAAVEQFFLEGSLCATGHIGYKATGARDSCHCLPVLNSSYVSCPARFYCYVENQYSDENDPPYVAQVSCEACGTNNFTCGEYNGFQQFVTNGPPNLEYCGAGRGLLCECDLWAASETSTDGNATQFVRRNSLRNGGRVYQLTLVNPKDDPLTQNCYCGDELSGLPDSSQAYTCLKPHFNGAAQCVNFFSYTAPLKRTPVPGGCLPFACNPGYVPTPSNYPITCCLPGEKTDRSGVCLRNPVPVGSKMARAVVDFVRGGWSG